jgi:hypothetical protein
VESTRCALEVSLATVVVTVFCWRTRTACSHSVLSLAVIAYTSYLANNSSLYYNGTYVRAGELGLFFERFYEDDKGTRPLQGFT